MRTVLVTGVSGFTGSHVALAFLGAGYHVKGTVRSEEMASKVRQTSLWTQYPGKVSLVIVPDLVVEGALDNSVGDVDGVIHTASPFYWTNVKDKKKEILDPSIKGTQNLLVSVHKHAPQVQRVVITSSLAALLNMDKGLWPEHTYSERDWNPMTYEDGINGDDTTTYLASKACAERAAFDFVKDKKPNFSISTVLPGFIYGPLEHPTTIETLNTSSAYIYNMMTGHFKEVPETGFYAFVDARDAAECHLRAYESAAAANERFSCIARTFSYEQVCEILRKMPEVDVGKVTPGGPGRDLETEVYKSDNSKAREVLGITFRDLETCIQDTARSLLALERKQKV